MNLKVKKLNPEAVLPSYATDGSNGLDLTATAVIVHPDYVEVRTAISVEIPKGYVGLLFPRSSITKTNMMLGNSVGVIDSDYRGEIMFRFKVLEDSRNVFKYTKIYKQGEKVGQLLLVAAPKLEVEEVKDLEETERGDGGFGSTGV
jgi:dUTP pyrophosphatase